MSTRVRVFAVVALAAAGVLSVYFSSKGDQNVSATRPTSPPSKANLSSDISENSTQHVLPAKAAEKSKARVPVNPLSEINERPGFDLAQSVAKRYAKAIKGLKLSAEDEQRVQALLIERAEVIYHARSLFRKEEMDNAALYRNTIAAAQSEVEGEIRAKFPPELSEKILKMIDARMYLQTINERVEPAMESAGVPLSPEQVLPLLEIFYETYDGDITADMRYVRENIDPTSGLTDLDEATLAKASSFLSPEQVRELRTAIVKRNNVIITMRSST